MNSQSYVPDRSRFASGHSDFIGELSEAIRQNPVPAALIGVGIAWLFMGGRHTVLGGASRSAFRGLGHGAQQAGGAAYQGAKSVGELASAGVNMLAEGATQAGSRAANAARTATDAIGDTIQQTTATMADVASSAAGRISHIGEMEQSTQSNIDSPDLGRHFKDTLSDLFARQPLLVGAIGLAIGAGIAASMPASEAEERLMGDTADIAKERAGELWRDTKQRAADTASRGLEEARKQGLTPEAVGDAARAVASKVIGVTDRASNDIVERLKR